MITIGLTTWSEHPGLINGDSRKVRLTEYVGHFPVVEIDTSFYGIPTVETVKKWQAQVPENFQFILKANQVMTHHDDAKEPVDELTRMAAFRDFGKMVTPLVQAKQLKTVLFQFPPFFTRTVANFQWLETIRREMADLPVAVEFRSPTWYQDGMTDDVIAYLKSLQMTHVITDEPHNLSGGVPFVPKVADNRLALMRFHGQNQAGWLDKSKDWRGKRTLYHYNDEELTHFAEEVQKLEQQAEEVCVIFNNNAGGDAAPNALALKDKLNIEWHGLGPQQMDLF